MTRVVYKITYDIRTGRNWFGGGNPNGWDSRYVLGREDARGACEILARDLCRDIYDDKSVKAVRILKVERVAENVLVK